MFYPPVVLRKKKEANFFLTESYFIFINFILEAASSESS